MAAGLCRRHARARLCRDRQDPQQYAAGAQFPLVPTSHCKEHGSDEAVTDDADRTARDPACDTRATDRTTAGESAGQSAARDTTADNRTRPSASAAGIAGQGSRRITGARAERTDYAESCSRYDAGTDMTGDYLSWALKALPECAMNIRAPNPLHRRNKSAFVLHTRHNAA